jgi:hypothetical protein
MRRTYAVVVLVLAFGLSACGGSRPAAVPEPDAPSEAPVTVLPLAGPLSNPLAEVSGLAWYGDHLLLLPQYPDFGGYEGPGDGRLFALSRAEVLAALDGTRTAPLEPTPIPFHAPGVRETIDGFEGYEALSVVGERVFLTIEAETDSTIGGQLVTGTLAPDLSALTVATDGPHPFVHGQSRVENMAEEALVVVQDRVFSIHEANGAAVNPEPVAHAFDLGLAARGTVSFPTIEYRITDATDVDRAGRFWVINYFFPGDASLHTADDPIAERHGRGATHARGAGVERLLELRFDGTAFTATDTPPVQLELLSDQNRNCEGLARLDHRGFLLVTDQFPGTILGFVPRPSVP